MKRIGMRIDGYWLLLARKSRLYGACLVSVAGEVCISVGGM